MLQHVFAINYKYVQPTSIQRYFCYSSFERQLQCSLLVCTVWLTSNTLTLQNCMSTKNSYHYFCLNKGEVCTTYLQLSQ